MRLVRAPAAPPLLPFSVSPPPIVLVQDQASKGRFHSVHLPKFRMPTWHIKVCHNNRSLLTKSNEVVRGPQYRKQQAIGYNKSWGFRGGATPKRGSPKIQHVEFYVTGTVCMGTFCLLEVPATGFLPKSKTL